MKSHCKGFGWFQVPLPGDFMAIWSRFWNPVQRWISACDVSVTAVLKVPKGALTGHVFMILVSRRKISLMIEKIQLHFYTSQNSSNTLVGRMRLLMFRAIELDPTIATFNWTALFASCKSKRFMQVETTFVVRLRIRCLKGFNCRFLIAIKHKRSFTSARCKISYQSF